MTLIVEAAPLDRLTPGLLPAFTLSRCKARATRPSDWDAGAWLQAVRDSDLRARVQATLFEMLKSANGGQYTDVDRETIRRATGVNRVGTISEHWQRAREHGLMASRHRYNGPSKHKLTLPWVHSAEIDDVDMRINTNTHAHVWTPDEEAWWSQGEAGEGAPPPWGAGPAPF